jgi:hypothetical protein
MLEQTCGTYLCGININTQRRRSFDLEIMFYCFPREKIHIWENSRKDGLAHLGCNIAYPRTLFFFFMLTILNQTQYWLILTN